MPVPEGAQDSRQLRGDAQQLGELVEHEQQWLPGRERGEALQRVVPIHERPRGEIAYSLRRDGLDGPAQYPELVTGGPPRPCVEDRAATLGKRAQQRGLAHPSPPPHERNAPPGRLLPPFPQPPQLDRTVDEHTSSVTDIRRRLRLMSVALGARKASHPIPAGVQIPGGIQRRDHHGPHAAVRRPVAASKSSS